MVKARQDRDSSVDLHLDPIWRNRAEPGFVGAGLRTVIMALRQKPPGKIAARLTEVKQTGVWP